MIKSEQDKRDRKIILAYLAGESVRIIAALNGLSTQQTHNILNNNKVVKRKRLDK